MASILSLALEVFFFLWRFFFSIWPSALDSESLVSSEFDGAGLAFSTGLDDLLTADLVSSESIGSGSSSASYWTGLDLESWLLDLSTSASVAGFSDGDAAFLACLRELKGYYWVEAAWVFFYFSIYLAF